MTTETIMPPAHPGEILLEEFLDPLNVSQYQLARDTRVRLGGSTRSCMASAVSAPAPGLRLARYFGTSERFWVNLQARYDLEIRRIAWAGSLMRSSR